MNKGESVIQARNLLVKVSAFFANRFFDRDGQLEFSPVPLVGIFGGYRYLDTKVDESDVFVDASFSGPYVGAFVRF